MTAGGARIPEAVAALIGLCIALAADAALAQSNWRSVAVPIYGPGAYVRGEALFLEARSEQFSFESGRLASTIAAYCDAVPGATLLSAQEQWRAAASAWDALWALSTGPLIERRSARSIDFSPTRIPLLERAIASAPRAVEDLERIGAPAKGFGALEWLLWGGPAKPPSAACSYAVLVAADIEREARALADAARQRAARALDDDEAGAGLAETVNQWLGGIEQLRWAAMRKPLDVAATRGNAPAYPRSLSGQTAASWAARWETLRAAAVLGERPVPVPGEASVPFETLLRGRGLNALADRLVAAAARVDDAFARLSPDKADTVQAAAGALGELARFAQDELAPALAVRIGFSDADGD